MKVKVKTILENKEKTIPILSFPSAQLLGIGVNELISSSEMQTEGMKLIYRRCNVGASLNMMDLSVEAEAFGAHIAFSENEIPTVTKGVIDDITDAKALKIPSVGDGRTNIYIEGVKKAKGAMPDALVFCGVIGPYSLAGRLFDMTELMMECYDNPEEVNCLVEKATKFITDYIKAFKQAGADGVVIAEPAAGLLSPGLNAEFSAPFVKKIIRDISEDDFVVCYHNCGDNVCQMADEIASLGADIYHFGNAINMNDIIPLMPADSVVMGNVDPIIFKRGTKADVEKAVEEIFNVCSSYDNFMISSGCDIPADSKWENIDAYFEKVKELYA